jgi:predicted nuclease of predicted toxin-antitoxin system
MAAFLVDENLPRAVADALIELGLVATTVRQAGLQGAADDVVLHFAVSRNATLITADLDFANLLLFPLGSHSGIVVLRVPEDLHYMTLVRRVVEVVQGELAPGINGSLAVVTMSRVRIRRP